MSSKQELREYIGQLAHQYEACGDSLIDFSRELLKNLKINLISRNIGTISPSPSNNIYFANHIGSLDTFILLSLMSSHGSAENIKLFVSEATYPFYEKHFTDENILVASHSPRIATIEFQRATKHLKNGNQVAIFPSGRVTGSQEETQFKGGLAYLIENADKYTQLTAVHIEPYAMPKANPQQQTQILLKCYTFPDKNVFNGTTRTEITEKLTSAYIQLFE